MRCRGGCYCARWASQQQKRGDHERCGCRSSERVVRRRGRKNRRDWVATNLHSSFRFPSPCYCTPSLRRGWEWKLTWPMRQTERRCDYNDDFHSHLVLYAYKPSRYPHHLLGFRDYQGSLVVLLIKCLNEVKFDHSLFPYSHPPMSLAPTVTRMIDTSMLRGSD